MRRKDPREHQEDCEDREEHFTFPGYVEWLRNKVATDVAGASFDLKLEHVQLSSPDFKQPEIYQCVVEAIEFGLPDTVLIVPPFYVHEWTRYDDTIDYHVECARPDAGPARVDRVFGGIFPYTERVPECIKLLSEYLRLFSDPATVQCLEPMVYTYWA